MKIKIILSLIIFFSGTSIFGQVKKTDSEKPQIQTIEREKFDPARNPAEDLKAAITQAQSENKRIILDVGGEWCIWCRWMDEYFIKNPGLTKLRDENFVWLKVNMSEENENTEFLSKYPPIPGYPHLFVLESDGAFLHSQGTAVLEEGKSYSLEKFTEFFKKWSPTNNRSTLTNKNDRRPAILLDEALKIANDYVEANNIDVSDKYISSIEFFRETSNKDYWLVYWSQSKYRKGGCISLKIFVDKTVEIMYWK